jgi:methyl-accepting chemotaxis protein
MEVITPEEIRSSQAGRIHKNIMRLSDYRKVYLIVFLLSTTPIALCAILWQILRYLFPESTFTSDRFIADYWVVIGIVSCDLVVLLVLKWLLIPMRQFVTIQSQPETFTNYSKQEFTTIEKKAYQRFVNFPNIVLLGFPIALITLEYTIFKNTVGDLELLSTLLIGFFYLTSLYILSYLISIIVINKYLRFFKYDADIKTQIAGKRVWWTLFLAMVFFGQLITTIYPSLPDEGILQGIIIFWVVGGPAIILIPTLTVLTTVRPVKHLLEFSENLSDDSNEILEIPNMNADEFGKITAIFVTLLNQARQNNNRNQEIAEQLLKYAQEMSANSEEITASNESIASSQSNIAKGATNQLLSMQTTQNQVIKLTSGVQEIMTTVGEIGDIAAIITNIANQTELLALNAAIEAARAGEAGRGFNVVADQVRKLADESKKAINRTEEMLRKIKAIAQSQENNTLVVKDSIDTIVSIAEETSSSTEEVSASIEEQSATLETVNSIAQELLRLAELLETGKEKNINNIQ